MFMVFDSFLAWFLTLGSGFISSSLYDHGFFSSSIKLPSNYTAGVVVAFYVRPQISNNCFNFDFLILSNTFFFFFFVSMNMFEYLLVYCRHQMAIYLRRPMTSSTSSSWAMSGGRSGVFRRMFTATAAPAGGGRSGTFSGLIPPRSFIVIASFGLPPISCNYSPTLLIFSLISHLLILIYIISMYINIFYNL